MNLVGDVEQPMTRKGFRKALSFKRHGWRGHITLRIFLRMRQSDRLYGYPYAYGDYDEQRINSAI